MKHVVRASAFVLVMGAACSQKTVGLNISVPSALSASAVWYEIGAFKDAQCGALTPLLSGGIPDGYAAHYAFKKTDPTTPSFGSLPNAKYAFAAVARDDKCAIIATGCSNIDAGAADSVSIALAGVDPQGACESGATCEAARCVPANDNSDPSVGANCSLELLGAGPLANSAGVENTLISAPAVAATKDGFIVAYREIDGAGGSGGGARLVVLPIDSSGGALRPDPAQVTGVSHDFHLDLPNRCSSLGGGMAEDDGVGLVLSGTDAMVTLAKGPCPAAEEAAPSLQLATLQLGDRDIPDFKKLFNSPSPTGAQIRLGSARPASPRPNGNLVVFTQNGTAQIANMDATKGIVGPNGVFGGKGVTGAWISANDKVLALLSVGPGDPGVHITDDAGADAGTVLTPTSDTTLRLLMLPGSTAVEAVESSTAVPFTFPGAWGSIASIGGRVIVVTGSNSPGRSVTYHAYDLGREDESDSSGFEIKNTIVAMPDLPTTAGDITIVGDRAYVAALQTGQVALQVFNNATTMLTPVRTVNFSEQTRISGISTVRDGSVAIAASDTRVAVVWTTSKKLLANDAAGGYAIFACTK